tara:strand:+ start:4577 stop:4948 length:372 start_codon:yes stop_codon:yes gene_type:complete
MVEEDSWEDTERHYLWEILIPASSTKTQFSGVHHKAWYAKIIELAGGLSVFKTLKGEWISPNGEVFKDRMSPVRISCTLPEIKHIMFITKAHYDELEIMAYKVSDHVLFYDGEKYRSQSVGAT